MGLTKAEIGEAVAIKKRLAQLVAKTGDADLVRKDKAYHENLRRYAVDNGHDDVIVVMGGDT